jgi:hypothetical protein
VRSHGPEPFAELFKRSPDDLSLEEFEVLFSELYDEQAGEVWERSQALGRSDPEQGCLRSWECSLSPNGEPRAVDGRCSDQADFVVTELDEGTWYSLYTGLPDQTVVTCEGDPVTDVGTTTASLPSYVFHSTGQTVVIGRGNSLPEVPLHPIDTSSCAAAAGSPLTAYQGPLSVRVPPNQTIYLGHPGLWYHAANYELFVEGDVEIEVCWACDDESLDCEPFDAVVDAGWFDEDREPVLKLAVGAVEGRVSFE